MDKDLEEEVLEIIKILNRELEADLTWPDPFTLGLVLLYKGAKLTPEVNTLLKNEWLEDPEESIVETNPNLKWSDERKLNHSLKMKKLHQQGRYTKR